MRIYNELMSLLPHSIKKRITKTDEGRSGDEIYKRRNRRNYRVIMQYVTWLSIQNEVLNTNLSHFGEGYVVAISPFEYFGTNYPERSEDLHPEFILGRTGFIYYTNVVDLSIFPPLDSWQEVFEISTTGSIRNDTWLGDVIFNVKNANPNRISLICKGSKKTATEKQYVQDFLNSRLDTENTRYPIQAGLGNYDYDYASSNELNNVKKQMLYLILKSKYNSESMFTYIVNNQSSLVHNDNTSKYNTAVTSSTYVSNMERLLREFEESLIADGLLNYELLYEIGSISSDFSTPSCPLCGRNIDANEFFEEIIQMEGRQVIDNTQREIVLMHIDALRPGLFNHKTYNLGWGHNYCNAVQGDRDISSTISELESIIRNYNLRHNR